MFSLRIASCSKAGCTKGMILKNRDGPELEAKPTLIELPRMVYFRRLRDGMYLKRSARLGEETSSMAFIIRGKFKGCSQGRTTIIYKTFGVTWLLLATGVYDDLWELSVQFGKPILASQGWLQWWSQLSVLE